MIKILLTLALLISLNSAVAHDDQNLKVKTLVKTTKSWDGTTLKPYAKGQPEITILEIEIPPKTKLPMHKHPYMNAGILTKGTLKVITDKNEVLILKEGDTIVEVIDKWHYGINEQDTPAKIIVFYAGIKGQPTTIKQKVETDLKYDAKHHTEDESAFKPLFDGKTFAGWEGDKKWFRVEDQAIIAGKSTERIPHNVFLCTEKKFYNFELRLKVKMDHTIKNNGGIQFRSSRIPNHHEVKGYQGDLGMKYWGHIYDESRRRKFIGKSAPFDKIKKILKDDWNDYTIRCENKHIRTYINGYLVTDYTEDDEKIAKVDGIIAVQIHGGKPLEIFYKNIRIKELEPAE